MGKIFYDDMGEFKPSKHQMKIIKQAMEKTSDFKFIQISRNRGKARNLFYEIFKAREVRAQRLTHNKQSKEEL